MVIVLEVLIKVFISYNIRMSKLEWIAFHILSDDFIFSFPSLFKHFDHDVDILPLIEMSWIEH